MDLSLWVKICGVMHPDQAVDIGRAGADAIGFISVPSSPRYVTPPQIQAIARILMAASLAHIERVGVFVNADPATITTAVEVGLLTALQLHGDESPQICHELRQRHPTLRLIKAFRIRSEADLQAVAQYEDSVDAFLLDAYHPQQLGGTGRTINWRSLTTFQPRLPWYLAGGLTPDNVQQALTILSPHGIDVSSGVEVEPGNKSLSQVQRLFAALNRQPVPNPG